MDFLAIIKKLKVTQYDVTQKTQQGASDLAHHLPKNGRKHVRSPGREAGGGGFCVVSNTGSCFLQNNSRQNYLFDNWHTHHCWLWEGIKTACVQHMLPFSVSCFRHLRYCQMKTHCVMGRRQFSMFSPHFTLDVYEILRVCCNVFYLK